MNHALIENKMNNNDIKYIFNISELTDLSAIDFSFLSDEQLDILSKAIPFSTLNSIKPLGNNKVRSLSILYEDRKYYYDLIIPVIKNTSPSKVFANILNENALYGLVDENLNAIYPLENSLKKIPSATKEPKLVMDFVADAFNELNAYINTAAMVGKISKDGPFFNLKAYTAYVKPEVFSNIIETNYFDIFLGLMNKDKELSYKIKDAQSFNKQFIDFIKIRLKSNYPVTKTATVFSSNFSSFMSGLIIDIKKDKADDDTIKFDKYWNHPDFFFFVDCCKRFGFKIDINVPWRIIADLNSPAMLEKVGNHQGFMYRYNLNNASELFKYRYRKVAHDELEHLKTLFYNVYSRIVEELPTYEVDYKKIDICDFNNQTVFFRPSYTKEQYVQLFPDTYWLRLYVYLRNFEEKRNFKQQEFENVVREANNYVRIKRVIPALNFVNEYFKQFKDVTYFSSLQSGEQDVEQKIESAVINDLIL